MPAGLVFMFPSIPYKQVRFDEPPAGWMDLPTTLAGTDSSCPVPCQEIAVIMGRPQIGDAYSDREEEMALTWRADVE